MVGGFKWLVAMSVAAAVQSAGARGAAAQSGASVASGRPWQVGFQELSMSVSGAPMQVLVWYPTRTAERAIPMGPYTLNVAHNASFALGAGQRALVVISHGTGGHALNHHTQAAALARAGYVVAAPMHPGDNFRDRSLVARPHFWSERPRHITAAIDGLLIHPDWANRIDGQKIGAIGHSVGGFSVAALIGLPFDAGLVSAHCTAAAKGLLKDPSCALSDPNLMVSPQAAVSRPNTAASPASVARTSAVAAVIDPARQQQEPLTAADPRIRAGLIWAPYGAVFKAPTQGWRNWPAPHLRVVGAELDELLPRRFHFETVLATTSSRPNTHSREALGAGHFSFISPPLAQWATAFGPAAVDPAGFDRGPFQDQLSAEAVAFFDECLVSVN